MKENFQENEVILHVDYSESYNNAQQDEIQSAYFDNSLLAYLQLAVTYSAMEESYPNVLLLLNPVTIRELRLSLASIWC